MVKHWYRLSRKMVNAPSLEGLAGWGSEHLNWLKIPLPMGVGLDGI